MLTKDDVRDSAGGWWMLPSVRVVVNEEAMVWVQEHFDTKNFNVKFFPWTDVAIWYLKVFTLCDSASRVKEMEEEIEGVSQVPHPACAW